MGINLYPQKGPIFRRHANQLAPPHTFQPSRKSDRQGALCSRVSHGRQGAKGDRWVSQSGHLRALGTPRGTEAPTKTRRTRETAGGRRSQSPVAREVRWCSTWGRPPSSPAPRRSASAPRSRGPHVRGKRAEDARGTRGAAESRKRFCFAVLFWVGLSMGAGPWTCLKMKHPPTDRTAGEDICRK